MASASTGASTGRRRKRAAHQPSSPRCTTR
jgi:hypothetical protein